MMTTTMLNALRSAYSSKKGQTLTEYRKQLEEAMINISCERADLDRRMSVIGLDAYSACTADKEMEKIEKHFTKRHNLVCTKIDSLDDW